MSFASAAFIQKSQIPQSVLDAKTRKELGALLAWSAAVSLPPPLVEFVNQYKIKQPRDITAVTLMAIQQAYDRRKEGNAYYFRNSETVIHPLGGGHVYSDKGVTVNIPNQKPVTYVSESGYPIKDPRPYSGGVIALVCSTLYISNGRLEFVFGKKEWLKVFPVTHAAFDPKGLPYVMHVMDNILQYNEDFKKMRAEGTGLKGPQLWEFLGNVINTCKPTDYIDLHDTIVKYFLQAIEFTTRRRRRRDQKAILLGDFIKRTGADGVEKRIIDDKTVATWPDALPTVWAEAVAKFEKAFGHRPFLLVGSIPLHHKWVSSEGPSYNESEAYEAYTTRRSIGSGGSNGPGVALECDGFSSGASTTSNRCVLLLQMVMNVLHHDKDKEFITPIDIRATINDVAYLERSLPLVLRDHHKHVKYLVDRYVMEKLSPQLKEVCVMNMRPDAHLIAWHDVDVDSVPKNGLVKTTLDTQWKLIISCFPAKSFTLMLPIISKSAFRLGANIFMFRKPADFQGIISSYPEFILTSDFSEEKAVTKNLDRIASWNAWLDLVAQANSEYTTFFLSPQCFYSPISNFIKSIAKGNPMKYTDGNWAPVMYNDINWRPPLETVQKKKGSLKPESSESGSDTEGEDGGADGTDDGDYSSDSGEEEQKADEAAKEEPVPNPGNLAGTVLQPEPSGTSSTPLVAEVPKPKEASSQPAPDPPKMDKGMRHSRKKKRVKEGAEPSYHDQDWGEDEPEGEQSKEVKFAPAVWKSTGM